MSAAEAEESIPGYIQSPHQSAFDFAPKTTIFDRSGLPIDVSGVLWKTNDPTRSQTLNWDDVVIPSVSILTATKRYFEYLLSNFSAGEVFGNWSALKRLWKSQAFLDACTANDDIPYRAISEVRNSLEVKERYRLHYMRKWYNWCCDQAFDGFSSEVAFQLNELTIGGNRKGEAVQSADPEDGPLTDVEIVALNNALRRSKIDGSLTFQEQVLLWLCIAFGSNSGPLSLIQDQDFEKLTTDDAEGVVYQLKIPRHKKGDNAHRSQFRTRRLNAEMGILVEALVNENRAATDTETYASFGAPLIRRSTPRKDIDLAGPLKSYSYHHVASGLTGLLDSAIDKLMVISPRTYKPLRITVRRLRYTFATRLVREGASQVVVADALDHTDLQNVQVYFDLKSDIVPKLDAAMAMELGPLSQAFLGHVVRSEKDAVRGDNAASRVFFSDKKTNTFKLVGNCGSFSFCGLSAPLACYTCTRFQAWLDGPHDKALSGLISLRQRRLDEGMDIKIISLYDNTILAIADVISRIDAVRKKKVAHG